MPFAWHLHGIRPIIAETERSLEMKKSPKTQENKTLNMT
jgi:hypothetical protein